MSLLPACLCLWPFPKWIPLHDYFTVKCCTAWSHTHSCASHSVLSGVINNQVNCNNMWRMITSAKGHKLTHFHSSPQDFEWFYFVFSFFLSFFVSLSLSFFLRVLRTYLWRGSCMAGRTWLVSSWWTLAGLWSLNWCSAGTNWIRESTLDRTAHLRWERILDLWRLSFGRAVVAIRTHFWSAQTYTHIWWHVFYSMFHLLLPNPVLVFFHSPCLFLCHFCVLLFTLFDSDLLLCVRICPSFLPQRTSIDWPLICSQPRLIWEYINWKYVQSTFRLKMHHNAAFCPLLSWLVPTCMQIFPGDTHDMAT